MCDPKAQTPNKKESWFVIKIIYFFNLFIYRVIKAF